MAAVIETPVQMVESVAALRLPPRADQRLQSLMDRNTSGELTADGRESSPDHVNFLKNFLLVVRRDLPVGPYRTAVAHAKRYL